MADKFSLFFVGKCTKLITEVGKSTGGKAGTEEVIDPCTAFDIDQGT
jgi:hypothetical protein